MKKVTLPIVGMTCAACARRLEKAVSRLQGTRDVAVNFATEKLSAGYDDALVSEKDIRAAVEKAGFQAVEAAAAGGDAADAHQIRKEEEYRSLRRRFRIAIEIDGLQHLNDIKAYRRDRSKDLLLQENGWIVVRVLADDIAEKLDDLLDCVLRLLAAKGRR